MNDTLSIVLPVRNAESWLLREIPLLLEIAGELTGRFDAVIVDDGSIDDTEEVARELATCYAQLQYVRHSIEMGSVESIRSGLDRTRGQFVLILDADSPLRIAPLARLWAERRQAQSMPASSGLVGRLIEWGRAVTDSPSNAGRETTMRLMRRDDVSRTCGAEVSDRESYLQRARGRHRIPAPPARRVSVDQAGPRQPRRPHVADAQEQAWRRYLDRVKDFALGE